MYIYTAALRVPYIILYHITTLAMAPIVQSSAAPYISNTIVVIKYLVNCRLNPLKMLKTRLRVTTVDLVDIGTSPTVVCRHMFINLFLHLGIYLLLLLVFSCV